MNQNSILLCGLPNSGKTTFIAALWYQLFNKEISNKLSMGSLPPNREYLNTISQKWCRFKKMDRTQIDEIQDIEIYLLDKFEEIKLNVPDMSGETWRDIWTNRSCKKEVSEWIENSSGIMLFLHADEITPSVDIFSTKEMIDDNDEKGAIKPWESEKSPTQVILIDILQSLSNPPLSSEEKNLAIIVSAWDKTSDLGQTPNDYIKYQLPMLSQYIETNTHFREIKIFGVSALGGDLDEDDDLGRLKNENVPSNRVFVVDGDNSEKDLTIPIEWLIP